MDEDQRAAKLLAAKAAATPPELDGPGVLTCGGCGKAEFLVTVAGRLVCADEDCYRLNGYAVITR